LIHGRAIVEPMGTQVILKGGGWCCFVNGEKKEKLKSKEGGYKRGKIIKGKKHKANPVTGCEGPWGCETSGLPHFLDSQLRDGSEVVSLTHRPPFTPKKIPGTHSVRG
jgi:hypothetical protein